MELQQIYRCLCNPTRLRIVHLLARGPLCVCHVQESLGLPQVVVSKQLTYLRQKGLAEARRYKQWVIYALPQSASKELVAHVRCLQPCARSQPNLLEDLRRLRGRHRGCERVPKVAPVLGRTGKSACRQRCKDPAPGINPYADVRPPMKGFRGCPIPSHVYQMLQEFSGVLLPRPIVPTVGSFRVNPPPSRAAGQHTNLRMQRPVETTSVRCVESSLRAHRDRARAVLLNGPVPSLSQCSPTRVAWQFSWALGQPEGRDTVPGSLPGYSAPGCSPHPTGSTASPPFSRVMSVKRRCQRGKRLPARSPAFRFYVGSCLAAFMPFRHCPRFRDPPRSGNPTAERMGALYRLLLTTSTEKS